MDLIKYVRMPEPLTVFGIMYIIYAVFHIISYLKDGYWDGIFPEIKYFIKMRFKYIFIFILVVIFIVVFIDKPISNLCRTLYNVNVYTVTDFVSHMGEGWFLGASLFTLAVILNFLKRDNDAIAFQIAFMTSILAGLINAVLKFVFNRERPVIGNDQWHFFHFFLTSGKNPDNLMYAYNSMPSGHTISVVSALTVLFCYSQNKLLRYLLVFFGCLIAYARVYTLNHWPSDVFASAVMGILIGRISYNLNKKRFSLTN